MADKPEGRPGFKVPTYIPTNGKGNPVENVELDIETPDSRIVKNDGKAMTQARKDELVKEMEQRLDEWSRDLTKEERILRKEQLYKMVNIAEGLRTSGKDKLPRSGKAEDIILTDKEIQSLNWVEDAEKSHAEKARAKAKEKGVPKDLTKDATQAKDNKAIKKATEGKPENKMEMEDADTPAAILKDAIEKDGKPLTKAERKDAYIVPNERVVKLTKELETVMSPREGENEKSWLERVAQRAVDDNNDGNPEIADKLVKLKEALRARGAAVKKLEQGEYEEIKADETARKSVMMDRGESITPKMSLSSDDFDYGPVKERLKQVGPQEGKPENKMAEEMSEEESKAPRAEEKGLKANLRKAIEKSVSAQNPKSSKEQLQGTVDRLLKEAVERAESKAAIRVDGSVTGLDFDVFKKEMVETTKAYDEITAKAGERAKVVEHAQGMPKLKDGLVSNPPNLEQLGKIPPGQGGAAASVERGKGGR